MGKDRPCKHQALKKPSSGSIKIRQGGLWDKEYYQGPRWLLPHDKGANSSRRHNCATLGKLSSFISHLQNSNNNSTCLVRGMVRIKLFNPFFFFFFFPSNYLIHITCLEPCLAHDKCSANVSSQGNCSWNKASSSHHDPGFASSEVGLCGLLQDKV